MILFNKTNYPNLFADFSLAAHLEKFQLLQRRHGQVIQDRLGFTFAFSHRGQNENISWRCSKRLKRGCKAYIVTCGEFIIKRINAHTHDFME